MDILKSQAEFYDRLSNGYDAEVGADGIESERVYRRFFRDGERYARGLDVGCGTGNWTRGLLEVCDSVLAIDASSAMIEKCREKLGEKGIEYKVVDVFTYPDLGTFDVVFSTFWISHVPEAQQEPFWNWVARSLNPGGRMIMQDSTDQGPGGGGSRRTLPTGEEYEIVKITYDFDDLVRRLAACGIRAEAKMTSEKIYVVSGERVE